LDKGLALDGRYTSVLPSVQLSFAQGFSFKKSFSTCKTGRFLLLGGPGPGNQIFLFSGFGPEGQNLAFFQKLPFPT